MEDELQYSAAGEGLDIKVQKRDEDHMISELEVNVNSVEEDSGVSRSGYRGAKRHKSELVSTEKKDAAKENKVSSQDSTELISLFRVAVISCDWDCAESMIADAVPQTLSDFLCFLLNYVWLLWTEPALERTEELIEMIMSGEECDFASAAIRSSRFAAFFLGCQCVNLDGTPVVLDESVQMLSEMAVDFVDFHSRTHGNTDKDNRTAFNIRLRLGVLETYLDLADSYLTEKDFTEALEAACFILVRFSSIFYPGWSYGTTGAIIMDFLGTLVVSGAESLDRCFLLASCYGSTELVQVFMEVAQRHDGVVDVDFALDVATYYGNVDTMEFLIEEGNATSLGPFVRAAARGSLHIVQWYIERGCSELEICVALSAATSNSNLEVAAYLLPLLPQLVLSMLGTSIIQDAGKSKDSLKGVDFLLHSNFVGDPEATYALADLIATSNDETVVPELKCFLQENWSENAYIKGLEQGMEHFTNMMRILKNGESPLLLRNLPVPLRVAIAYLPVYKECVDAGGSLLSQRLRGQLVEAVWRLGNVLLDEKDQSRQLLDVMEHNLRPFL